MPNNSQNLKLSSPTGTLVSCQKASKVNKKRNMWLKVTKNQVLSPDLKKNAAKSPKKILAVMPVAVAVRPPVSAPISPVELTASSTPIANV